jgi:Na+-transporting NADH:ubiquinone oxidoreductase subunit NqrC
MNSKTNTLKMAEDFVTIYGDLNWWREQYTILRENNNVLDSIQLSLEAQDLWTSFVSYMSINTNGETFNG